MSPLLVSALVRQYVDYDGLKRQLDLILAFQSGRRGARPQKAQQEAVAALKLMFQASLDAEIAKVVTFYKQKILDIGNELRAMQVRRQELMDVLQDRRRSDSVKLESVQEQQARWRNLAVETKWLLGFISLNMSGIRKIVKKFSKNVGAVEAGDTQGPKLVSSLAIRHPHEPSFEIHQASFLSAGLVMDLDTMQRHKELSETQAVIRGVLEQLVRWKLKLGGSMPASSSAGDLSVVGAVNDDDEDDDDDDDDGQPRFDVRNDTGSTVDGESSSVSAEDWRWLFSRTHSMLPDFGDVEQLEPILKEIRQEAEQAERNAALVVAETSYLSAQLGVFEEAPADQDATATSLGILLNLLNVLLYMLNYNLAIPTTEKFCSHLGVPAAVGGMVIGASDITALVVALGYSAWTNYSFKIPLLFSAAVCLSGNILYSLAYDLNSLPLLIAGRLLIGAGAARALNRRYIADFVRRKDRTMASAMFVAASAGGMALGPLLALPLAAINTQSDVMGTLNDITVGGWSMVVVWAAFILVAAAFFGEPLKRRPPPPLADLQEPLLPADGAAAATKRRAGGRLAGVVAVLQDAAMLPTLTCVLLLFMLKLLQQGTVSATPLFVGVLCDWQAATAGLFLCIAAVAMLPLNFGVGVLSKRIADRPMIIACLVLCLLGCVTQIQPAAGRLLTSQAYFFGYMVTYASTIVLEGVTMSAMSKVMNPTWARGTFNMGLLATQSGSTGRLLGNLSITWLAEAIGLSSHLHRRGITALANVMYSSFLAVVLLCVLTLAISYRRINV